MVHSCYPSYSGSRDEEVQCLKPSQKKGGVAQGVALSSNPCTTKKKKKNKRKKEIEFEK
jgi:hypothetical protein